MLNKSYAFAATNETCDEMVAFLAFKVLLPGDDALEELQAHHGLAQYLACRKLSIAAPTHVQFSRSTAAIPLDAEGQWIESLGPVAPNNCGDGQTAYAAVDVKLEPNPEATKGTRASRPNPWPNESVSGLIASLAAREKELLDKGFKIPPRSASRVVVSVKSEAADKFHALRVEHYSLSPGRRNIFRIPERVGHLTFVFVPDFDPFGER